MYWDGSKWSSLTDQGGNPTPPDNSVAGSSQPHRKNRLYPKNLISESNMRKLRELESWAAEIRTVEHKLEILRNALLNLDFQPSEVRLMAEALENNAESVMSIAETISWSDPTLKSDMDIVHSQRIYLADKLFEVADLMEDEL